MNKKRYSNITKSNNTNKISESNTKSGILQNLVYGASVGTGASIASNTINSFMNKDKEEYSKCHKIMIEFFNCMNYNGENFLSCRDNYIKLKECYNI